MASDEYITLNKANWDERAPEHARAPGYCFQRLIEDPNLISDVVAFDIPLMGDIQGLEIVHLQCHIGTDTISLARRGAKRVVGLDFSSASLKEARRLADSAAGGDRLSFVEASVYDADKVLEPDSFDMVFTGIGALCWIPSIRDWAKVVHGLLKPGGRLFIREGHPVIWSMEGEGPTGNPLNIMYPYFEVEKPTVFDEDGTYVKLESEYTFANTKTNEWNHGLGEIVQSLIDVGMLINGLVEHRSVPWQPFPGIMKELNNGEFELKEGKDLVPLSYTLQAVKGGS